MYGYTYGFWPVGTILWILFIIFLVWFIISMARRSKWHDMHYDDWHGKRDNAIGILKERYAKGEIDKKEFEEKKSDLTK